MTQTRALLLYCKLPKRFNPVDIREFCQLSESTGLSIQYIYIHKLKTIQPKCFCHLSIIPWLITIIQNIRADTIVFSHAISASNQKNLSRLLKVNVLDINEIILDIFAQRAQSKEGKLQVELAQLLHLSSKLVKGWTHLERQKGGIGLRGPGEKQLETDRRLIKSRIIHIKNQIRSVEKTRLQQAAYRKKSMTPLIALIGYTNVGKSSLFNSLTKGNALCADKPFATLDPLIRKIKINKHAPVHIIDTVGFIHALPKELKQAFKSTLDVISRADLLIHVIDNSNPCHLQHIQAVNQILTEINADNIPQILAYNKSDISPYISNRQLNISTYTHQGIPELLGMISDQLQHMLIPTTLEISMTEYYIYEEIQYMYPILPKIIETTHKMIFTALLPASSIKQYSAYIKPKLS
ncbi:MAG TPA: GTPase HflX [Gammaproteobacteria bacterium]|nr:GTPase HflX [Gammaproteobacteria bacterium]